MPIKSRLTDGRCTYNNERFERFVKHLADRRGCRSYDLFASTWRHPQALYDGCDSCWHSRCILGTSREGTRTCVPPFLANAFVGTLFLDAPTMQPVIRKCARILAINRILRCEMWYLQFDRAFSSIESVIMKQYNIYWQFLGKE